MGMTDRQYEDRQKKALRELQDIKEEIEEQAKALGVNIHVKKLERAIQDIEEYLQRP